MPLCTEQQLQPCADQVVHAKSHSGVQSQDTAIIFDWDDTLLASTWLASHGLRLDTPAEIPAEAQQELRVLEGSVIRLLNQALALGTVHLVTNAEAGWIELSAAKFIPNVVALLPRVHIISARSTFEKMWPDQPKQWKVEAFRHQIGRLVGADNNLNNDAVESKAVEPALNVLSFGDSVHERDALRLVTDEIPNALCKSIKFVERPTMEQLQRQLDLISQCMDNICLHGGDLDLMLTTHMLHA